MLKSLSELTQEEYDTVVEEITKRWKDLLFMNAEEKVKYEFSRHRIHMKSITEEDKLVFYFELAIIWNDIIQIVGRIRRRNARKES